MKLKVLVAPVLIVIIVVLAVWYVYPAFQEMQGKTANLTTEQNKLADIQEKNSKAEALGQVLKGDTVRHDTLLSYIPEQESEEDMISTLNSLAGGEGLSVFKISISAVTVPAAPAADAATTDAAGNPVVAPSVPVVKNFVVELGVTGNYAKIKDLLGKIAALQRFNSIASLKINKVQNSDPKADDSASDNLQADVSLNFNYMAKSDAVVNLDNAIFSSNNFDMSVVDNIKSTMTTVVNGLTVGPQGVTNPFVK